MDLRSLKGTESLLLKLKLFLYSNYFVIFLVCATLSPGVATFLSGEILLPLLFLNGVIILIGLAFELPFAFRIATLSALTKA